MPYNKTCPACKKPFETSQHAQVYCCRYCSARGKFGPLATCLKCGKTIQHSESRRKYCSRDCLNEARREETLTYRPFKKPNKQGYMEGRIGNRKVLEHRYVMELLLGRPLRPDEVVHHKDGNPANNSPSNLALTSRPEHRQFHHKRFRNETHKECTRCGEIKPRSEFHQCNRSGTDPHCPHCRECDLKRLAARAEKKAQSPSHAIRLRPDRLRTDTHKECTRCGEVKPRSEFHPNRRKRDRDPHFCYCKACTAALGKVRYEKWRQENPLKGPRLRDGRFRSDTHKQCSLCQETKPRTEFYSNSPTKTAKGYDPHQSRCKLCICAAMKDRYRNR